MAPSVEVTRLFVGNLPSDITKQALRDVFARVGDVRDVFTPWEKKDGAYTKVGKGYAFVEMCREAEAHEAIRLLNGTFGAWGAKMCVRLANARAPIRT